MVPDLSADFKDLPTDYQRVLSLAQERHSIKITPLEELKGGRTGARLYLVSVSSATPANGSAPGETRDAVQHFVLKVDRINPKAKTDEMTRHALAVHRAPSDFAAQHLADLAFERVEHEGAIAIFYAIAGQSLHRFQPLASFRRQSQLETIFRATFDILLAEWNAQLSFEQAVHPQSLLERWLGYRLKSGGNIERLLEDVFHIHHGTAGFLIQGHVFPNPLVYAREPERWGPIRLIDAIIGMQHGDLNITNILVRFASNERDVDGFYLIDFALFQEQMPLLYDQAYLEMSYLLRELSRVPFQEWVGLVTHLAELDIPCPDQVSASLTGACAVIAAGRAEYDRWLQASHASLYDDLWGQFWLAAVAAGLNFCNKAPLSERERLGGLIYAAAHLKRYLTRFGARMPVQISHLYDASQSDAGQESDATLRAPALRINNLPVQPSPLVGREKEVLEVRDMIRQGEVRLLTLTGPGGMGKTRLGLQVATELIDRFQHGVCFVPLAEITAPELVVSEIAQNLGVREGGSQPLLDNLNAYLLDKQMMLLLDNFEQVVAAAPLLANLLAAAPQLKILVTSRTPLNLRGEHEFQVPPLALPGPTESPSLGWLRGHDAVRLFIERARAVNASFALTMQNAPAVAEICRRLDGLPLAIELAAARVKVLSPRAMLEQLAAHDGSSLQLLTGGARDLPARQQTLRDTLNWSYSLLNGNEQTLFARLGVFVGGFTLEAAQAVCSPQSDASTSSRQKLEVLDGIESLVDNSLLRREDATSDPSRFRMLETIHAYALERLDDSGEREALQRAHALFFASKIIDEIGAKIFSPETSRWLDWIESEHDNIQGALAWSQTTAEGLRLGPALTFYLGWFWYRRGYFGAGRAWSERVLASPAAEGETLERALALQSSALMAMWQGDLNSAVPRAEESLVLWRRLQDEKSLAIGLLNTGTVLINAGDDQAAHPLLKEAQALFRELGDRYFYAIALVHLGNVALGLGDPTEALTWLDEAYAISREMGENWLISFAVNNLGEVARVQGAYDKARAYYEESKALLADIGDKGDLPRLFHSLGYVALRQGHTEQAAVQFQESLAMFRVLGNKRGIAECLAGLGGLAVERAEPDRAARLLGAADALLSSSGAAWWPADRVEFRHNLAATEDALSADVFSSAWEAGQALTLAQAIAYAASEDIQGDSAYSSARSEVDAAGGVPIEG